MKRWFYAEVLLRSLLFGLIWQQRCSSSPQRCGLSETMLGLGMVVGGMFLLLVVWAAATRRPLESGIHMVKQVYWWIHGRVTLAQRLVVWTVVWALLGGIGGIVFSLVVLPRGAAIAQAAWNGALFAAIIVPLTNRPRGS